MVTNVASRSVAAPPKEPSRLKAPAPSRRKSLIGTLFVLGLGLTLAVVFAPALVAKTPLRHSVLNWLVPELAPGTQVAAAQFGWLSPVLMNGVIFKDDEGRPLLSAESITSSGSLLDLIQKPDSLGEFVVEKPVVEIVIGPKGSNLDTLRERLSKRPGGDGKSAKGVSLQLKDGIVRFSDNSGKKLAELADLNATYKNDPKADPNHDLKLECRVAHPNTRGTVFVDGAVHFDPETNQSHGGEVEVKLTKVPIDMLHPLLAKSLQLETLRGTLDTELHTKLKPQEGGGLTTDVRLTASQIELQTRRVGDPRPTSFKSKAPVQFALAGVIDLPKEQATLEGVSLQSEFGNLKLKGTVSDWSGDLISDLSGEVDYDLRLLLAQLPPEIQNDITIKGLAVRNITLKGPLKSLTATYIPDKTDGRTAAAAVAAPDSTLPPSMAPPLEIGAEIAWQSAVVFGVQSNKGLLRVSTSDRTLRLDPVNVPIGTGRFSARPQIPLDKKPLAAVLSQGPVLENVETTEQMCRTWLKYISPLMADATAVDGRFSLAMDQAIIPLDAPGTGVADGKLLMQKGRVGPGPIADEILQSVGMILQVAGQRLDAKDIVWMNVPPQEIPFQLKNGRVTHGLTTFNVGGVIVTSQGSMGTLDRSLDVLVEFRLPDEWLRRGPVLAALQGEPLRIKIGGTLDKPQIDNRPLADFGQRAGMKAAAGLLFEILERRQQRGR